MSLSALEFIRTLADNRVLDAGQLEGLQPYVPQFRDSNSLTQQLIDWGWLSTYQAEKVLAGDAASLLFGDYRLVELLGQGGMGQVFKASHLRLGRVVALKMIRPQTLNTTEKPADLVRRFQREAQAAAQLLHPNVVILFDYNEIGGIHFIAMEYVDGVDLARMVKSQNALPIPHACEYIRQASLGLQHAHEFGMVHRDIKPQNLLVTRPAVPGRPRGPGLGAKQSGLVPRPELGKVRGGGVVKILDFGLVRLGESLGDHDTLSELTMQGTIVGTPDYISPEQARDATKVDIRSDLYSLGCTFYFLLTGQPPFPAVTSVEKLFKHQNEQPEPIEKFRPNIPREVVAIVQRLMAKRPEGRYQAPAELAEALQALPSDLLTGRAMSDAAGNLVAAAVEVVQAERGQTPVAMPTQMFSPDALILPAKKYAVLQGHRGYVTALQYSPDGRLLASGGIDGTVRLWEVDTARPAERPLNRNEELGEVHHLAFAPDSMALYSGSTAIDGHNWRWDWSSLTPSQRSRFEYDKYRTSCFAVSPDGLTVAAGSASAVLLYDSTGRKPTIYKGHGGEVRALVYSNNGKRLYSAGQDKRIILWEPGRFWSTQRTVFEGHTDSIVSLAFAQDGSLFASASLDGTIRLWDASGASNEAVAVLSGHSNGVRAVRFANQGALVLSVGDSGQVFLWDVLEQAKVREWQIDKAMMHAVAISPDCRLVATGMSDGQVVNYDLEFMSQGEQPAA